MISNEKALPYQKEQSSKTKEQRDYDEQKIHHRTRGCSIGTRHHCCVSRSTGGTYINGATNEYSFRMKEEDRVHEQNVRKIRFEFQRDGNQEKYDRAMKEEQKRHDQEVKNIKRDYDKRTPWRR